VRTVHVTKVPNLNLASLIHLFQLIKVVNLVGLGRISRQQVRVRYFSNQSGERRFDLEGWSGCRGKISPGLLSEAAMDAWGWARVHVRVLAANRFSLGLCFFVDVLSVAWVEFTEGLEIGDGEKESFSLRLEFHRATRRSQITRGAFISGDDKVRPPLLCASKYSGKW
jgi:hypothetical protein